MQSPRAPAAAIVLCIVALASAGRAAEAAPAVVASILPLHSLAAFVMQDVGVPQLLLRGGESPHTFSLRPSDARMLRDADVLFWIGPELERPLERILPNLPHLLAVAVLDAEGVERLPARDLDLHPDSEAHPDEPPAREAHTDPHLWLSPANAMAIGAEIARVLSERDPDNAVRYRANSARLRDRLLALDQRLQRRFASAPGSFAVFHDAYQYLERRYALHTAGSVTTHPERSPGIAHLRALRERLVNDKVRCLFSEPQFQPRLIAVLSEGLAIRHAVLDPLGADIAPGPNAYEKLMQTIANRYAACMQNREDP